MLEWILTALILLSPPHQSHLSAGWNTTSFAWADIWPNDAWLLYYEWCYRVVGTGQDLCTEIDPASECQIDWLEGSADCSTGPAVYWPPDSALWWGVRGHYYGGINGGELTVESNPWRIVIED